VKTNIQDDSTRKKRCPAKAGRVDPQLGPSTLFNSAATGLAYALGEIDPAAAQSWAASVNDETLKQQTLSAISKMKSEPAKR
jgi:hypothetical protein